MNLQKYQNLCSIDLKSPPIQNEILINNGYVWNIYSTTNFYIKILYFQCCDKTLVVLLPLSLCTSVSQPKKEKICPRVYNRNKSHCGIRHAIHFYYAPITSLQPNSYFSIRQSFNDSTHSSFNLPTSQFLILSLSPYKSA